MKTITVISVIIAVFILTAIGAAILFPLFDNNANAPAFSNTTPRGEQAQIQASGLYKFNPVALVREGIIWDWVNLILALPLFVAAIVANARGSFRGRLLLGGLLCYFCYVYLMDAMMYSINVMFPFYVAIFALSAVAFFLNMGMIRKHDFVSGMSPRFPRRFFAGYFFTLAAMLIVLWSSRIIPIIITGIFPPELAGLQTLEAQALDLGMIVPMAISAGVLLLRKSVWGYILCGIGITHGLMMFVSIPMWIIVPLVQDGRTNLFEAIPFMFVCLLGIVLFAVYFKTIEKKAMAWITTAP